MSLSKNTELLFANCNASSTLAVERLTSRIQPPDGALSCNHGIPCQPDELNFELQGRSPSLGFRRCRELAHEGRVVFLLQKLPIAITQRFQEVVRPASNRLTAFHSRLQ